MSFAHFLDLVLFNQTLTCDPSSSSTGGDDNDPSINSHRNLCEHSSSDSTRNRGQSEVDGITLSDPGLFYLNLQQGREALQVQ